MFMQPYFDLLNNFFDKIYVITLQRAADRHQHIEQELKGLQYVLFYGKDKNTFDVGTLQQEGVYNDAMARRHHRFGKSMPPGMIGCSWSHRLVYEDVIKNSYKRALVLEDDILIDKRLISLLPQILTELPPDWELVYFGYAYNEKPPKNAGFKKLFYRLLHSLGRFKFSHKTINNLYPQKISEHIYTAGYHDCTHAYAITNTAAQKLSILQQPITFFPDNLLAHAVTNELVKGYIVVPRLINQPFQVSGEATHSYINQ